MCIIYSPPPPHTHTHARAPSWSQAAKAHGDFLLVGVHGDEEVGERRGPHQPILAVHERALSVLACKHVDEVIIGKRTRPCFLSFFLWIPRVAGTVRRVPLFGGGSLARDCAPPPPPPVRRRIESPHPMTVGSIIRRIVGNREQVCVCVCVHVGGGRGVGWGGVGGSRTGNRSCACGWVGVGGWVVGGGSCVCGGGGAPLPWPPPPGCAARAHPHPPTHPPHAPPFPVCPPPPSQFEARQQRKTKSEATYYAESKQYLQEI